MHKIAINFFVKVAASVLAYITPTMTPPIKPGPPVAAMTSKSSKEIRDFLSKKVVGAGSVPQTSSR